MVHFGKTAPRTAHVSMEEHARSMASVTVLEGGLEQTALNQVGNHNASTV